MKQIVADLLKKTFTEMDVKIDEEKIFSLIEKPKDYKNGDFSFPCFPLAKELKENPANIALNIRQAMKTPPKEFESVETIGPYLNFHLNKKSIASKIIKEVDELKDSYGKIKPHGENLVIEFPSPNTNKPLHLGHLRNMSVGESVSRIANFNGFEITRVNLNNDRGIHICKSMLAYKKWGKEKTPKDAKKKSDHFVGDFYVKFAKEAKKDESLEKEAQEMLQKWEEGDKETLDLWFKMNKWALEGFDETYKKFGIKIDKHYFESEIYKEGKDLILKGLKEGIFHKREDGAIAINLEDEKLGEKVLLRSDGTSIYITQDIYLAKKKFEEFSPEQSIYVTGNEQEYHFKVLFSVLEKLGLASREKLEHLSYGMVNLPNGRMKSREGTVVDSDDLIEELQDLVKKELKKRYKLTKKDLEDRSLKIALSALKYFLLKIDVKKDMTFNPDESISFDGNTGPYCQYSYARASSILNKAKQIPKFEITENDLEDKEIELIVKLNEFKKVLRDSYKQMNPAILSNYAYKLSQIFNEFYHSCQVIGSRSESLRLHLVKSFRQVLKNSLYLLGIEVLEEMWNDRRIC